MEAIELRGIRIFPFSKADELIDFVDIRKGILVAVNAEKMVNATSHLIKLINTNIGYCDGSGIVLAARQKGAYKANKIAGCELWLSIIKRFQASRTFYIIGGRPNVHAETMERLKSDFPNMNVVGNRDGYLNTEAEREALIRDVVAKKPDFVFVAMGSPRQEYLMEEMSIRHKAVYQGLGGSFDVYAGHVRRAPKWWIDHNIEFLYRLMRQPSRIRRDWVRLKFAWWLLFNKF